tara:strand:+ start:444 stop:839 length:396 start_codon:yes stop_codon:yes gene_type:complete
MADIELLKQYIELHKEIAKIEGVLKERKSKLKEQETLALEVLSESGVQRLHVNDRTVYIRRDRYASVKDRDYDRANDVLKNLDLDELVNTRPTISSVSAWVREQYSEDKELPKEFSDAFEVSEVFRVGVTK